MYKTMFKRDHNVAQRIVSSRECVCVVVVEINNMYPSTNGALFSGYRLCSAKKSEVCTKSVQSLELLLRLLSLV